MRDTSPAGGLRGLRGQLVGWCVQRQMPVPLFYQQAFWLSLWYGCSAGTLFLNKIILTQLNGDVQVLGCCQMATTALLGALKVYGSRLCKAGGSDGGGHDTSPGKPRSAESERVAAAAFRRNMLAVAIMRSSTIILGLVSLANVAASFTETIKASAPFFTVIFSQIILRETTSVQVNLSLVPVMFGLMLASASELTFNTIGFLAAVSCNCIDCIQNVFSKKLLNTGGLSPVELQFYTSLAASVVCQIPLMLYSGVGSKLLWGGPDGGAAAAEDPELVVRRHWYIAITSVLFHFQSVTAYFTMSVLSTVSQVRAPSQTLLPACRDSPARPPARLPATGAPWLHPVTVILARTTAAAAAPSIHLAAGSLPLLRG
eukprot:COSAG01_NODE_1765_length_9275_cov_36.746077_1_plen_372_part_00